MRVPDVAGKITAYRTFVVSGDTLRSTGVSYVWRPGVNKASCSQRHGAPVRNCGCGFWSFKDAKTAIAQFTDGRAPRADGGRLLVLAKIKVWGKVVEGKRGFRSRHAEIVELSPWTCSTEVVQPVAKKYGARIVRRTLPVSGSVSLAAILPSRSSLPVPLNKAMDGARVAVGGAVLILLLVLMGSLIGGVIRTASGVLEEGADRDMTREFTRPCAVLLVRDRDYPWGWYRYRLEVDNREVRQKIKNDGYTIERCARRRG